MKKISIVYAGYSEEAILDLVEDNRFCLRHVISTEGRLSRSILKVLELKEIKYTFVKNKGDLIDIIQDFSDVKMMLIYCFGIIIPPEIYSRVPCFNIHTGDLKINRGPYPLVWDILENRRQSTSTLYRIINDDIDTGEVVSVYKIDICSEDNIDSLAMRLDKGVPYHLDALVDYDESNNYIVVRSGVYHKKVSYKDIQIYDSDELVEIKKKIRSQSKYGGAIIKKNEYWYRVSEVLEEI